MDLNANFHGLPVKYWLIGGSGVSFIGLAWYRKYRKAKAAASGGTTDAATSGATNPLPGWSNLGPLGGSSPTGPLTGYTSSGEAVYGRTTDPATADGTRYRRHAPDDTKVSVPAGETVTAPAPLPTIPTVSAPPPPATYTIGGNTLPLLSTAAPVQLQVGDTLGKATGTGTTYISPGGGSFIYG